MTVSTPSDSIQLQIHGQGRPYRNQGNQPITCAKPHRQIEYQTYTGVPGFLIGPLGRMDYRTRHAIKIAVVVCAVVPKNEEQQ
jgi:hypothetical protein